MPDTAILQVSHLSVSFDTYAGKVEAVRDISFALHRGETLALVGESGCGKSVTCRSIMRLLARNANVDAGEILFSGEDLLKKSNRAMRDIRGGKIAMIFQDPMTSLDPTMKIGKQIAEAVRLHRDVSRREAKARAEELLSLVGIDEPTRRYHQYPHEFSGGQRQRIVIAIALAADPEILIADEPTTALDVTMQAQIIDLIRDIQKKTGTSVIFITHDLGVVANVADRVAVMYAGRIVEIGLSDEVFYDPRHPYTWGLLASMPTLATDSETLYAIPGTPPTLIHPAPGDAFAPRNPYALEADRIKEPPLFQVSDTHYAATWLLDPRAPKVYPPESIRQRQAAYQKRQEEKEAREHG
ncbi:MAG: ABC transporter ATP-binding protein [Clostridia bacterium]|nr:ABC transporter ATP-binding protein [Clostridia bacterium]